MKIVIPSYHRPDTATTPHWLVKAGYRPIIVLHSHEEARTYENSGALSGCQVVVTDMPIGIHYQRQWIEDHLVDEGEWYLSMDDNLTGWQAVHPEYYLSEQLPVHTWKNATGRPIYQFPCTPTRLMEEIIPETISKAETLGANLCGFAHNDNYYYRGEKWKLGTFVCAKSMVKRKVPGRHFDPLIPICEDYDQTLLHLQEDGVVVVNRYAYPVKKHYTRGGCGTLPERLTLKKQCLERLQSKWPRALYIKSKRDQGNVDPVIIHSWAKRQQHHDSAHA